MAATNYITIIASSGQPVRHVFFRDDLAEPPLTRDPRYRYAIWRPTLVTPTWIGCIGRGQHRYQQRCSNCGRPKCGT